MLFGDIVGYATDVIADHDIQEEIIRGIHSGLDDTVHSQSMGGYLGQNKTREKIT